MGMVSRSASSAWTLRPFFLVSSWCRWERRDRRSSQLNVLLETGRHWRFGVAGNDVEQFGVGLVGETVASGLYLAPGVEIAIGNEDEYRVEVGQDVAQGGGRSG